MQSFDQQNSPYLEELNQIYSLTFLRRMFENDINRLFKRIRFKKAIYREVTAEFIGTFALIVSHFIQFASLRNYHMVIFKKVWVKE